MVAQNLPAAEFILDAPESAPRARPSSLCLQPIVRAKKKKNLSDKNTTCVIGGTKERS